MPKFPEMFERMPEADALFPGVTLRLLQGPTASATFVEAGPGATVPEHSHGAQWGIVVEGELHLTIGSQKTILRRGDEYFIAPGIPHAATLTPGTRVIDVFDVPDRFRPKGGPSRTSASGPARSRRRSGPRTP
jgi:quercetin dioxygenase-like cupin family protein